MNILHIDINNRNMDKYEELELEIEGSDSNKAYGIINGLIYAPGSKVELEDGIKISGGGVGNTVEVEDRKTIITYDPKYI